MQLNSWAVNTYCFRLKKKKKKEKKEKKKLNEMNGESVVFRVVVFSDGDGDYAYVIIGQFISIRQTFGLHTYIIIFFAVALVVLLQYPLFMLDLYFN